MTGTVQTPPEEWEAFRDIRVSKDRRLARALAMGAVAAAIVMVTLFWRRRGSTIIS